MYRSIADRHTGTSGDFWHCDWQFHGLLRFSGHVPNLPGENDTRLRTNIKTNKLFGNVNFTSPFPLPIPTYLLFSRKFAKSVYRYILLQKNGVLKYPIETIVFSGIKSSLCPLPSSSLSLYQILLNLVQWFSRKSVTNKLAFSLIILVGIKPQLNYTDFFN